MDTLAIRIKGSQGKPRRQWLYADHPFTAVSEVSEVHANTGKRMLEFLPQRGYTAITN